ncbi:MAG TPA: hypothetical protein VE077_06150 [Candidatus Methylomirabilis sp.]|nr:hypothetical protein [Candidatus Methylomirabilis sp.]
MKTLLVAAALVCGAARATYAQEPIAGANATTLKVTTPFSAAATSPALNLSLTPSISFALPSSFGGRTSEAWPSAPPYPAPEPKFVYGGRDDYRWQVAIGADWLRFRSSIFNASTVGIASSVTYFTNEWFGIEGDVITAFAPEIYDREHVKLLVYGGGPKIAWRERQWEPWMHAIVGGSHEQPQTAGNSRNAFAVVLGGGADYRFNPRFSGRLEGDWVRSSYFSQSQNNFELMGGVVFHF